MSKSTRLCVLAVSLLSLFGVFASSAGAITWHNSGSTTFTGTSGAQTLTVTNTAVICTSALAIGTVPALTVGALYRSSGTVTLTGCSVAGTSTTTDCAYTMTGTSQDGAGMGSTITGTTDVTCRSYISGSQICHINGTVSGSYLNNVPSTTTLATGGNLIIGGSGCPLGTNDLLHVTTRTINSTSANPPTITRTV